MSDDFLEVLSDDQEPYAPPPFVCEDAAYIRDRMRQIADDRQRAEYLARSERERQPPPASIRTGFVSYEGPPTRE